MIVSCPNCNKEREISRVMEIHIRKGRSSKKCMSCCSIGNKRRQGHLHSEETKLKMSLASLGKQKTKTHCENMSKARKGIKRPDIAGENHYLWIHDRENLKKQNTRNDSANKEWRKQVWTRDEFKCRIADNNCDGRIEAHHILGWSEYPELRYQVNNGITLCHAHHPKKRAEEKRLSPYFQALVSVSK